MTVEDRKESSVRLVRESVRPLGRRRAGFGHVEADLDQWAEHVRPPPRALDVGDPAKAIAIPAQRLLDDRRSDATFDLRLQHREDLHLEFTDAIRRLRPSTATRFADRQDDLERDPGPCGDVFEGLVGERTETVVAGLLHELEVDRTIAERLADPLETDPARLERADDGDTPDIRGPETRPVVGDRSKDPERAETIDISLIHAGTLGELGPCARRSRRRCHRPLSSRG